jgi:glutamate 5-kinase
MTMSNEAPQGHAARAALGETRRLVVKIGSRSLMADGTKRYESLARQLSGQRAVGRHPVLVSSGAVAMGRLRLGLTERPKAIDRLQAAAATGQSGLMRAYEDAFEKHGVNVAQVLFTHADLADRDRYLNARGCIDALLELNVIPIINENDTVSVDELRFSDNDQLAAMVANLTGADLLVLLTDVEGGPRSPGQARERGHRRERRGGSGAPAHRRRGPRRHGEQARGRTPRHALRRAGHHRRRARSGPHRQGAGR